jgi:hypothetical protein
LTYSIGGNCSIANATVNFNGPASGSVTADSVGNFTIPNLPNGSYTVMPTSTNYVFIPTQQSAVIANANVVGLTFGASPVFAISGNAGLPNAIVNYSGPGATGSVTADGLGNYTTPSFHAGAATITPTFAGYRFVPSSTTISGSNVNLVVNFTAEPATRYGNPQVQKLGMSTDGTAGTLAMGWYTGNGFVADPKSPNAPTFLDALSVVIPNSGTNALTNFSVLASGIGSGSGTISLCLNEPLPGLIPGVSSVPIYLSPSHTYRKAINTPQLLPSPVASVVNSFSGDFVFEVDVAVVDGVLSGTYLFQINGMEIASGPLVNLPANAEGQPIAAYLQVPAVAHITNISLLVSVAGYTGPLQTLNL